MKHHCTSSLYCCLATLLTANARINSWFETTAHALVLVRSFVRTFGLHLLWKLHLRRKTKFDNCVQNKNLHFPNLSERKRGGGELEYMPRFSFVPKQISYFNLPTRERSYSICHVQPFNDSFSDSCSGHTAAWSKVECHRKSSHFSVTYRSHRTFIAAVVWSRTS